MLYDGINTSKNDSTYTLSTAFISKIEFLYYLLLIIINYRLDKDKVRKIKIKDRRGDCLAKVDEEDLGELALTPRTGSCFF